MSRGKYRTSDPEAEEDPRLVISDWVNTVYTVVAGFPEGVVAGFPEGVAVGERLLEQRLLEQRLLGLPVDVATDGGSEGGSVGGSVRKKNHRIHDRRSRIHIHIHIHRRGRRRRRTRIRGPVQRDHLGPTKSRARFLHCVEQA